MEITGSGSSSEELCDEDLVHRFEEEEKAKGVLDDKQIRKECSQMLGRYLENKWKKDGNREVFLASGRVKKLPGSGNVPVDEWERWIKDHEMGDVQE
jgi:hypothetical protein